MMFALDSEGIETQYNQGHPIFNIMIHKSQQFHFCEDKVSFYNKKVLLRERKRHTARCIASTRYAALSNPDLVGGVPHPDLVGGVPQVPPKLGWGTPTEMVYPPRPGMGYPPQTWDGGYPPDLDSVPPRPGTGYPKTWDRAPQAWDGVPLLPRPGM